MKIKNILSGCLLSLLLIATSCNDFLDVKSPSKFDDDYVYASENEIFRAVTGIYNPLTLVYGQRWATAYNSNCDVEFNDVKDTPSAKGEDFACFEPQPYWTEITSVWNYMYQGINLANTVIQGIENSPLFKSVSRNEPSDLMQMYGEAKTLRAMMFHDVVRTWGDVPFKLTPTVAGEDFELAPTDRNEILTTLINDLIEVEPLMKYASEINFGAERASREYCQGLIALMALTRGGYSLRPDKGNPSAVGTMKRADDWKDYYKIAEKYAGMVINSGKHNLNRSFEQIWKDECNYIVPSDDDIIFDVALLRGGVGEYCYYVGIPIDSSHNGSTGTGTNPYGKASGSYSMSSLYMMSFDKDDLRRDATCALYRYDANLNQNKLTLGASQLGGVKVAKYNRLFMNEPLGETSAKSPGVNATYMRYADVLLMYAEAVNENNGSPTPEAKEALKQIRRRAFPKNLWGEKVDAYVDSKSDKESFFEAIFNERKWEFGGEGKRRFELARWNLYGKVLKDMYITAMEAGQFAHGIGGKDHGYPSKFYWKQVDDPDRPGYKKIDIVGLFEPYEGDIKGWNSVDFATKFWNADNTPSATLKRAFRGYFTPETVDALNPDVTPVRYLLPFSTNILSTNSNLQNYYGF